MELKEMIKVMQHFEDGGDVEYSGDNFETIFGKANNNKNPNGLSWAWDSLQYRIKEEKQKVTIETWLCRDTSNGENFIYETSKIDLYIKETIYIEKVKLIESYEVEI